MKFHVAGIFYIVLSLFCFADTDTEAEALRKAYPWIYTEGEGFRYESVSLDKIHDYCNKHQGEMSIWYEEYKKRFGEVAERKTGQGERRPENGLLAGVAEFTQIHVTFYINKRSSEGWKVVGMSGDFFVFEKRPAAIQEGKQNGSESSTGSLKSQPEGNENTQPASEGSSG